MLASDALINEALTEATFLLYHVRRHGLALALAVPQVNEALTTMARKILVTVSANGSGLVWSSFLAAVRLSSTAGLDSAGDQKSITSCQPPGSFHMLSGECPCQLA